MHLLNVWPRSDVIVSHVIMYTVPQTQAPLLCHTPVYNFFSYPTITVLVSVGDMEPLVQTSFYVLLPHCFDKPGKQIHPGPPLFPVPLSPPTHSTTPSTQSTILPSALVVKLSLLMVEWKRYITRGNQPHVISVDCANGPLRIGRKPLWSVTRWALELVRCLVHIMEAARDHTASVSSPSPLPSIKSPHAKSQARLSYSLIVFKINYIAILTGHFSYSLRLFKWLPFSRVGLHFKICYWTSTVIHRYKYILG